MRFRPCIDLHQGRVKQMVGETVEGEAKTYFVSSRSAAYYADLYRRDGLGGGHVIMLGRGNEAQAQIALRAFPGGLQIGGGITPENAPEWLERGAHRVIITSYLFPDGKLEESRLKQLQRRCGREHVTIDLSCSREGDHYYVMTNRWSRQSHVRLSSSLFDYLFSYCSEFLIHAVDVEGKRAGPDTHLLRFLGKMQGLPFVYAGGISAYIDIEKIDHLGQGRIDYTVGAGLDIFGGDLRYETIVHHYHHPSPST